MTEVNLIDCLVLLIFAVGFDAGVGLGKILWSRIE